MLWTPYAAAWEQSVKAKAAVAGVADRAHSPTPAASATPAALLFMESPAISRNERLQAHRRALATAMSVAGS